MFLTRCLDSHKPCVSVKFKRNVFQSFSKDIVHLLTCYCCKIFAGYTLQYLQLFWIFSQLAEFLVAFSSHLTLIKYYNISWFTWLLGWVYAVENSDYTESSIFPAVFFFYLAWASADLMCQIGFSQFSTVLDMTTTNTTAHKTTHCTCAYTHTYY